MNIHSIMQSISYNPKHGYMMFSIEIPERNNKLVIMQGSVLTCKAFALVNATNIWLVGTAGIDRAFDVVGGEEVLKARDEIPADGFGVKVPEGEVVVTTAGSKLDAKYIIHACGPDYGLCEHRAFKYKDVKLKEVYKKAIREAVKLGGKDIGFCLISAGAFAGFRNLEDIIRIGMESILEELQELKDFTVYLYAYTREEQYIVDKVWGKIKNEREIIQNEIDIC